MSLRNNDQGSGLAGILALLCALVATAAVAGLIGAGLFMPAVGAAGATARNGANFFDALPAEFKQSPLAQQSRILAADGSSIATFYDENRLVVPLAKIAPVMQAAQVAIEDSRFREHGGIDPKGVVRAVLTNASTGETQGASTLTQQFVKLTLQENAVYAGDADAVIAAVDKNLGRKISEMKIAVTIEDKMTKDQILEGYLNIAYYGDGVFGIETAARHYFSTTAAKLTLPQAAMLAGLVQAPGQYDPRRNPKAALGRRNVVLGRMLATKAINQKQHDAAVKTKLNLAVRPIENGCDGSEFGFFCDYVYKQILTDKSFGATTAERRQLVFRGGLTIRTTLDPKIQRAADAAVRAKVAPVNKSNVEAVLTSVAVGGQIKAMTQSSPYGANARAGQTKTNYSTDNAYGGSNGFAVGSTFKAFTLAAALEAGKSLSDTVDAPEGGTKFPREDFNSSACWQYGNLANDYSPYNSESHGESGVKDLVTLTKDSINTGFVALEAEIGVCKVKAMAENLGVHQAVGTILGGIPQPKPAPKGKKQPKPNLNSEVRPWAPMTLGPEGIAPLTMAAAYATFAANGMYCKPTSIVSATTLAGKILPIPKPACSQVIKPDVARGVTYALERVITDGTAARVPKIGRPAAGKTGTTNKSMQTWFVGYTPQLSTAVYFGNPNPPTEMQHGVNTGKEKLRGPIFGATVAAPIWSAFMKRAHQGMPVKSFAKPGDKMLHGEKITVPGTTGMGIGDAIRMLEEAGFKAKVGDLQPSMVPLGAIAGSNPPAGSRTSAGAQITIYPSTGIPPIYGPDYPGTPTMPPTTIIPDPRRTRGPGLR